MSNQLKKERFFVWMAILMIALSFLGVCFLIENTYLLFFKSNTCEIRSKADNENPFKTDTLHSELQPLQSAD